MTRISSLFVASTLAILPISAFAQTVAAPAKPVAPTGITTTQPNTDAASVNKMSMDKTGMDKTGNNKTAPVGKTTADTVPSTAQPTKPAAKTTVHGMNSVGSPHAKAKTADPAKS